MPYVRKIALVILTLLIPTSASAAIFGEGFSSPTPNAPADIRFRAFTIYSLESACEASAAVERLNIMPNPLFLAIGDRVHRSNESVIVIEAYDENGEFLPSVPLVINLFDDQNTTTSRSDWDYFEAVREGEARLFTFWACAKQSTQGVEASARIVVTDNK